MTWLFVNTVPEDVSTIPEPAPLPPVYARRVLTTTTPVVVALGAASEDGLAASTIARKTPTIATLIL
jgi:hypothetical protein